MRNRSTMLYWALMLIPSLLLGGAMLYFLGHEQERLKSQVQTATLEKAKTIGDGIRFYIDNVCTDLDTKLDEAEPEERLPLLKAWQRRDPLVRNIFMWTPPDRLIYPDATAALTEEEASFVARYRPFFSGKRDWRKPDPETGGQVTDATAHVKSPGVSSSFFSETRRSQKASAEAYEESKVRLLKKPDEPTEGDWIRWFDDNRLHLLCWRYDPQRQAYWGLELERIMLLSNLVANFPEQPEDMTLLLRDGSGNLLHQSGTGSYTTGEPDLNISLSPELPHWSLSAYTHPVQNGTVYAWIAASVLIVLALTAAVVSGGFLITAESKRNWRDAQLKTTFVANVSHELKTPLTTIRMYSEMLKMGKVREEKRTRYLETVVDECGRLTRLVNNILDFNRLEQGRRTYNLQPIDLAAFLSGLIEIHRPRIEQSGLQITLQTETGAEARVMADRDALEQILLNLIDNAAKYAKKGGVIELTVSARTEHAALTVADRGPGIPAAHRKRIFSAFHRVDDSLTTDKPGAGLGLSIAKELAMGMGGALRYQPRPGSGSLFEIELPRATQPEENGAAT